MVGARPTIPFTATGDLILRAVTELNEDARQQVIAAAEERGAAATREAIAKGLEHFRDRDGDKREFLNALASRVRAGELG